MANPTMTLIGSPITVGSGGATSVTFSSIPATYTDLIVKASVRTNIGGGQIYDSMDIAFNGVTTNITAKQLQGTGASAASTSPTQIESIVDGGSATANTFANLEYYIPNYTSSNYKSASLDVVMENNATTAYMRLTAGLWSNTAAITSVGFTLPNSTSFVQYSTFYLYGIKNS
jgi:hypothetical protein